VSVSESVFVFVFEGGQRGRVRLAWERQRPPGRRPRAVPARQAVRAYTP